MKVKNSIKQEQKFISLSEQRVNKLSHEEDLIKVKDVIDCLKGEQESSTGAAKNHATVLKNMVAKQSVHMFLLATAFFEPSPIPVHVIECVFHSWRGAPL